MHPHSRNRRRAARLAGLLLAAAAAAAPAQTPTHLYTLDGTFADFFGGPSMVSRGGTLGPTGYTFGYWQGPYVAGVLASPYVYSIETRFRLDDLIGYAGTGWVNLIDFKNVSEWALYSHDGVVTEWPHVGSTGTVLFPNQWAHLVATRAADNTFTVYVDGALAFGFVDTFDETSFTSPGGVVNLFYDNLYEQPSGALDYVAIYDRPLTPAEAAYRATHDVEALTGVPEPSDVLLVASGLAALLPALLTMRLPARRRTA